MPEDGPRTHNLRLFVAIELPDDVRTALQRTIDVLQRASAADGLRWVRPESIHLTLKFLGATSEGDIPAINTALRIAVRDTPPFHLRPGGIGSFGGRRGLRVVWVSLDGDTPAVTSLAAGIDAALQRLNIEPEQRALNPHLTLARVREGASPEERARIHDILARVEASPFPEFTVTAVSLMQSTLQRGGAVYNQLASYPLEGTR